MYISLLSAVPALSTSREQNFDSALAFGVSKRERGKKRAHETRTRVDQQRNAPRHHFKNVKNDGGNNSKVTLPKRKARHQAESVAPPGIHHEHALLPPRQIKRITSFDSTGIDWNQTEGFPIKLFRRVILPREFGLPMFRVNNDGQFIFGAQPGLSSVSGRFRAVKFEEVYKAVRVLGAMGIMGLINVRGPQARDSITLEDAINRYNASLDSRKHIRYESFALRFSPHDGLATKVVNRLLGLFKSHAHKPMFVHCYGGADRSGLVASLYAITQNVPFTEVCQGYYATGHGGLQNPVGNGFHVLALTIKTHHELRPYYLRNKDAVDGILSEYPSRETGYHIVETNRTTLVDGKPQPIMTYEPLPAWAPVVPSALRHQYRTPHVGGASSVSVSND